MQQGDIGAEVAQLQRQLIAAGFSIEADGWFGPGTEAAVKNLQKRAGLVVDGIVGRKTLSALATRERTPLLLSERDIETAAQRLGVEVAAIKAINEVESAGAGFLPDGRPVILYERHQAFRLLGESGMSFEAASALADRYPNLINPKRGGYLGKAGEWARLASASQIIDPAIAQAACSWGQYQIMGYHWATLGYASIDEFVAAMRKSEGMQLEAFCRFIESEPALHKALKARRWADFAKGYNGPAYKDNLYDTKLARAYVRHTEPEEPAA